ncbi:MAG TPA: ABC transporter ATP-binding protein [Ilumatobacteraceae bacterium]|nr:ABC transporter ATP-binding protein [Ilumatobacteraceae bacterium]
MGRPETRNAPAGVSPSIVLRVDQLQAGYGRKQVVFDVDLTVHEGEIVGVLGHNGSGKTTTIRTILGLNPVIGGRIEFKGRDATRSSSRANVKAGMAMIPSERFVFADLTVDDNLLLGAANDPDPDRRSRRLQLVRDLFPILVDRAGQLTGTMSGGQQRMVSLGTALMASPTLLMLDEPSLGLAPAVVHQIFDTVRRLADEEGLAVLLLEQNVGQALRIVDRVYVMRSGRVILEESVDEMRNRDSYWELF